MNKQALRWAVVVAVAVIGAAVLLEGLVSAKPPAPPPPPGSICFWNEIPIQFWAMNGDGSGKQAVTPPGFFAIPSNTDHGGHTWWLCTQVDPDGGYYPDTTNPVREVYLVRADYENVLQSVKLTDLGPTDSDPGIFPYCDVQRRASWSNDLQDTFVSFIGKDRADGKHYVYRAAVSFPDNADPFLSEPPQQIIEVEGWTTPFHWSPDGTRIVYQGTSASNGRTDTLNVYTLATGTTSVIYEATTIGWDLEPRWSPPDVPQRIAFADGYALTTIDPDVTSDVKVVYYKGYYDFIWYPHWSPDGKYLVGTNVTKKMGAGGVRKPDEIAIVPSQGGAKTILTADMPDTYLYMNPAVWRWLPPVP